jgi:hypothetical protein
VSTTKAPAAPRALRAEIENVLTAKGGYYEGEARLAATAPWIARRTAAPLTAVQRELEALVLAGRITTRTLRSSEVLYKLTDPHHHQWSALRGPAHSHN